MPTLLCVPIMVRDMPSALADAQAARDAGADLVEFRIDDVFSGSDDGSETKAILKLVADSPLPCIVTCRSSAEGGHYDGDDMARVSLYERLGTASGKGETPPRYIDVELATYTRSANLKQKVDLAVDHPAQLRDLRTSLILSMHDFNGRPSDLTRRVMAMRAEPAAKVLKVAFRARSLRDNLELFELIEHADRPMIALGMGEFGLMSRVLAPKFGGFLTFASLHSTTATAPGQPTLRELLDLYRFRSISPTTRVYGVIGWPVTHSMSPLVHNAGFAAAGHDGVYLPLPIPSDGGPDGPGNYENFKATLGELVDLPRLNFCGASVTLPHKENLIRLARDQGWEIDPTAALIGAANTLHVERAPDGRPVRVAVFNTDAPAIVECLAHSWGSPEALRGKRIGIIGAGGVGRGAAVGLAAAGANVVVYNRSADRAAKVAKTASQVGNARQEGWDHLAQARCDAFVHCTSLGMKGGPAPDMNPLPVRNMSVGRAATEQAPVVLDTVYNPIQTPLLREARAAGWRTIDGVELFARQAGVQSRLWTGLAAPEGMFDRMVRDALGGSVGHSSMGAP